MMTTKLRGTIFAALLCSATGSAAENTLTRPFNLEEIGHLSPKGRAQDSEYNPDSKVVAQIISHGTASIPLLIKEIENKKRIRGEVMDYWGSVRVGDVAFILLVDLFTNESWEASTVVGFSFDELVGGKDGEMSAQARYQEFLKKNGRTELRRKWATLWDQHKDSIYWDSVGRCFRVREKVK